MQLTLDSRTCFFGEQASDDVVCTTFFAFMNYIKNWSQGVSNGKAEALSQERFQDHQKVTLMYALFPIWKRLLCTGNDNASSCADGPLMSCTRLRNSLELEPARGLGQLVWAESALADTFRVLEDQFWLTG